MSLLPLKQATALEVQQEPIPEVWQGTSKVEKAFVLLVHNETDEEPGLSSQRTLTQSAITGVCGTVGISQRLQSELRCGKRGSWGMELSTIPCSCFHCSDSSQPCS